MKQILPGAISLLALSIFTLPVQSGHHEAGEQPAPAIETSEAAIDAGFIALSVDEIELQRVPGLEGITAAILYGNPDESGPYVLRVRFDKEVRSPPHSHNQDRFITVIEGTWHFGTGVLGGCAATKPLPAGSFAFHPKGELHFDGSCGDPVIVEIRGEGPVSTDFIQFN